jgi:hypothetical protein
MPLAGGRSARIGSCDLGANDFVQALDNLRHFLWRRSADELSDPFARERSDLANFHPGFFRQSLGVKFERQGETRSLRLARKSNGNDGSGTFIKNVLAENQNWTSSCLLTSPYGI